MGVGDNVVINHPAPISCIQVPMLEARVASQIARNNLMRSGDQAADPEPDLVLFDGVFKKTPRGFYCIDARHYAPWLK
jgi:hypothetical protein